MMRRGAGSCRGGEVGVDDGVPGCNHDEVMTISTYSRRC